MFGFYGFLTAFKSVDRAGGPAGPGLQVFTAQAPLPPQAAQAGGDMPIDGMAWRIGSSLAHGATLSNKVERKPQLYYKKIITIMSYDTIAGKSTLNGFS
jgi:hypothetical protein